MKIIDAWRMMVQVVLSLLLLAGCVAPSSVSLKDPTEPFRDIARNVSGKNRGGLLLKSIGLIAPLREVRAEDGSFLLTTEQTDKVPFYSNDIGPFQNRYLAIKGWRSSGMRTVPVRLTVDGVENPLYGRLAIFPAANVKESLRLEERFHVRITVTPESLAQMEREGVGYSCPGYHAYFQDWCDWALWISKSPIPE